MKQLLNNVIYLYKLLMKHLFREFVVSLKIVLKAGTLSLVFLYLHFIEMYNRDLTHIP